MLPHVIGDVLPFREVRKVRRQHGRDPQRIIGRPVTGRVHRIRVQFRRAGTLDSPGGIGAVTVDIIRIGRVVHRFHQDTRIEADDAAGGQGMVFLDVQRCKRTVGTVAHAHHRGMHQCVRIEIVFPRALCIVVNLHQVRRIHRAPPSVLAIRKNGAFIPPGGQVLHRCGPFTIVLSAIAFDTRIVRTRHIDTVMTRIVRILEYTRFPVGNMFPQGQVRITDESGGLGDGTAT